MVSARADKILKKIDKAFRDAKKLVSNITNVELQAPFLLELKLAKFRGVDQATINEVAEALENTYHVSEDEEDSELTFTFKVASVKVDGHAVDGYLVVTLDKDKGTIDAMLAIDAHEGNKANIIKLGI